MIEIIKKDGKPVGWKLCPKTEEEQLLAGTIRDLQFFGFDDTKIVYDGLELINPDLGKTLGNIKSISWIQEKHSNQ